LPACGSGLIVCLSRFLCIDFGDGLKTATTLQKQKHQTPCQQNASLKSKMKQLDWDHLFSLEKFSHNILRHLLQLSCNGLNNDIGTIAHKQHPLRTSLSFKASEAS
jgi:hypothetical protein